jgi:hypothetical protein
MSKKQALLLSLAIVAALALGACSALGLGGGDGTPSAADGAGAALPTQTPLALAPTLPSGTATPSDTPEASLTPTEEPTAEEPTASEAAEATVTGGGPTPLPEPTQIGATEAAEEEGEEQPTVQGPNVSRSAQPGIQIQPQLGEPEDIIMVYGDGFEPGETVRLHWAAPGGDPGPVYYELDADDEGSFEVGLIVLPADRWPGGAPSEGTEIELQAHTDSLGENYYWARFKVLPRVTSASLVLDYVNEDYGYGITVPNGWTWTWSGEDTSDVRFKSPEGAGAGFILVEEGDVDDVLPAVMAAEFPGQTYTTGDISAGAYPGTQATLDGGRIVQFIPSGGRVYVLSFVNDSGQPALDIFGQFELF